MTDRPQRGSVSAVAYAVAVTALGALPVWVLSAYAPAIQEELGFDSGALGVAIGAYFAVSALTSLPVGRLVDRLHWRRAIALTSVVAAVSLLAAGLLSWAFLPLVAFLLIGSISNGMSQPAGNLAIAASVRRRTGLAFGFEQAALPISTFVVGLSVPLFDGGRAWREAYVAAAAFAFAVLVPLVARRALRFWRENGRSLIRPQTLLRRAQPGEDRESRERVRVPRPLVLLALATGFGGAATVSLGGFTVSYATAQGFTPGEAGALLAFGSIVGIVSRIVSGFLADRRKGRHLLVVAAMMLAGAIGMAVIAVAGSSFLGLVLGIVLAFGLGWAWNGVFHLAVVSYSGIPAAVATSFVQIAVYFGVAVGPVIFGFVATLSYELAWLVSAAGLLIAAVLVLLARRAFMRHRRGGRGRRG